MANNATIPLYSSKPAKAILNKLVIFGVGLIGGSVALALKQQNPTIQITGVGRNAAHLQTAIDLNIIDAMSENLADTLADADMIMIATPVAQTPAILESIKPHLNHQTVITDAGSTKTDVLTAAKHILGNQFKQFVGGHPIAGAEKSGATAAFASLYQDKNVVLTPTDETDPNALSAVENLWKSCGAKLCTMRAADHDEVFAMVSHLPHILAFALVNDIANHPNAEQLLRFAASGFRDFSRIAGSHPEMWRDISLANKDALLASITQYQSTLEEIKTLIANSDGPALEARFKAASQVRNDWADNK